MNQQPKPKRRCRMKMIKLMITMALLTVHISITVVLTGYLLYRPQVLPFVIIEVLTMVYLFVATMKECE
jgi:hypothetical protein